MDTPRTNLGDATYLGRPPPDFDMTLEPSFQSPSKDGNLLQQLRNGQGASIRTPRGSRAPLGDRRNVPAGIGGSEFTPMLKSATQNRARRRGKENTNGLATPALGKIDEDMDMTNVPVESSLFGPSRNLSYADATALPEVEASSTQSTPLVLPTRRGGSKGLLQDGNQLSLREQENVIDKIEKENFGLKLKIHFLEEALRKTGPGFSEATVKENTELKVDKFTMQRELQKYKKHLASAEKDLETYQQQILEVRERAKQKYADQDQKAENDALQRRLEDRDAEIEDLKQQLNEAESRNDDKSTMEKELAEYKRQLESAEKDIEAYEQQLLDAQQEKDEQKHTDESHKAENEDLQRRLEDRDDEIEDLKRQLQRSQDDDKATMQREISKYEKQLKSAEKELEIYRHQILEAEEKAKQDYADQKAEIDALHRRLEDQDAEIQRYAEQMAEHDTLRRRLQDRNADIQKYADQDAENDALRRRLKDKDMEIKRYAEQQAENDHLRRRLQEQAAEVQSQQKAENDTLRRRLQDQEAEIQKYTHQMVENETLRRRLREQETEIQRYSKQQAESDQLRRRVQEQDAEIRKYTQQEAENDALRRRLKDRDAEIEDLIQLQRLQDNDKETKLRNILASEAERHKSEEAALNRRIDDLRRDLEVRHSTLTNLHDEISKLRGDLRQSESDRQAQAEKIKSLEDEIDVLQATLDEELEDADQRAKQTDEETKLRNTLASETERHKTEEAILNRRIEDLRRDLEARQSALTSLHEEISALREDLLQSESDRQVQAEKIEALEDEVEVLQATLDDESEDASQKLREANELCQDLERQLELSKREKVQQTGRTDQAEKIKALEDKVETLQATLESESEDASRQLRQADELRRDLERQLELSKREKLQQTDRLGQLADANSLAEQLRQELEETKQELEETKQDLQDAEQECEELKAKIDVASRQESKTATQASQASEDLGRQLLRAQKEAKKAKLLCEDLRSQLDAARRDLDYATPLCHELRQKLDRARSERAAYQASVAKLEVDCERLKKGAQDALAWIQAKNAQQEQEQQQREREQEHEQPTLLIPGGPIKKARATTFRYGDMVRDVVDQKDHEAVIRAANSAQRRHEKEIRGMALQMEWMQARWEREAKLRNDGAFAKKFLQLRLDIADACNKADLRILNRIHQDLGLKPPAELLARKQQQEQQEQHQSLYQKSRKPAKDKLKVFVAVVRAVARMRVDARRWGEHEKTRQRLVAAWEEQNQNQNQNQNHGRGHGRDQVVCS